MAISGIDVLARKFKRSLGGVVVLLLLGNVVALRAHESSTAVDDSAAPAGVIAPGGPAPAGSSTGPLGASSETTVPPRVGGTTTTEAPRQEGTGAPSAPVTTTPMPPLPPEQTFPEGYDFKFDLSPTCALPGQEMKATVHLKRLGGVVFRATYSDGETHGTTHAAGSMEGGPVTYTWIAPGVPGPATLLARAHDPEDKRNGRKSIEFRIAKLGELC